MDRYNCFTTSGGRVTGEIVYQEGKVVKEEARSIEPGQYNATVLPRRLTSSVIQAIDSYQNHKGVVPPQASHQFQGHHELIEIPPNNPCMNVHNFNFQLSDVSIYNQQDRVDHIEQNISTCGLSQFSCLQLLQDEKTMYRSNSSYQMTQIRTAQTEKESFNKWQNFKKPYVGKRVLTRKPSQVITDLVPERKKTAPINLAYTVRKSRVSNSVQTKPYRDRVIHLLALKDYKKHELLLRLQKDGIPQKDKNSLDEILQQVAILNTENFLYTLKDCVFKEVKSDWPGYNEIDRQTLELVLSRKNDPSQNDTGTNYPKSRDSSVDEPPSSQKQFFNSGLNDSLRKRKVRISHLTTRVQPISTGYLSNNSEESSASRLTTSATNINLRPPPLSASHCATSNHSLPLNSNCHSCSTEERPETQDTCVDSCNQNSSIFENWQSKHTSLERLASISIQIKHPKLMETKHLVSGKKLIYKFTKEKAKSQVYNFEMMKKHKTDPKRQDKCAKPRCSKSVKKAHTTSETCSTSELPDYLTDYCTIVSSEQRQRYEQEFIGDYAEYWALNTKILNLFSVFINLDSKRKQLSPESKEYHDINEKISLEYQKIKQTNPNYYAEKSRCLYLYKKLAHIKKLINDFDQQ